MLAVSTEDLRFVTQTIEGSLPLCRQLLWVLPAFSVQIHEVLSQELSYRASLWYNVSAIPKVSIGGLPQTGTPTLFSFSTLGTLYVAIVAIFDGFKLVNDPNLRAIEPLDNDLYDSFSSN